MQEIIWTACIVISNSALALVLLRLRESNRKWFELQARYEGLLQNYQALEPIQKAIEAAMAASQPGESGCVTITVQQIDPSEAPSIGLPPGSRLH